MKILILTLTLMGLSAAMGSSDVAERKASLGKNNPAHLAEKISDESVTVGADDERIVYIGRFGNIYDDDDSAWKKQFAWPASQIAVNFQGTSIEASLYGSKNTDRFLAIVDGKILSDFETTKYTWETFTLAEGLDASANHSLVLWKATEDLTEKGAHGATQFGGFSLPEGGDFFGNFERKARKIEFVGDSDTAGWCADGSYSTTDNFKYQNSYETWAAQLARALDAEHSASLAISGIGVLLWPIQQYLNYTCPFDDSEEWDWTTYTPDAVVMLIGPNDPSTRSHFEDKFIAAYTGLMAQIADKYAYAEVKPKIISVCGGSINGLDPCPNIQTAIANYNANDDNDFTAYYTTIAEDDWNTINTARSDTLGCDSHYSPSGHAVLEGDIVDQVKEIMGWD